MISCVNMSDWGKELFSWGLEVVTLTEPIMIIAILTLEALHFRVLLICLA